MTIDLPPLAYARDALEPHISRQTLDFHYGKHHQAYVNKLNALLEGRWQADVSLEEIIQETAVDPANANIFNNAAQVWNHTFYWSSMKPSDGGAPTGAIAEAIKADFGGVDGFKEAFSSVAKSRFGSGWAWLVKKGGKLDVSSTPNAETPLTEPGVTPLLTMDVWEHAYYLDYQNNRPAYVETFIDKLVNWDFANANLAAA